MLELEPLEIPTGTGLSFRFEASRQPTSVSRAEHRANRRSCSLRVVTEEELRTDLLRREKEQRQEFERLMKNQDDLLTDCRASLAGVKGYGRTSRRPQKDQLMQYHKRQKLVGQNTARSPSGSRRS